MADPTPHPTPSATPAAASTSTSASASAVSTPAPTPGPAAKGAIEAASAVKPKAAPVELTGFRSALSHTGIPHSVLTWKPKLPSRNWLIFWTITASLSGAYYYDTRECNRIKQETIKAVEGKGQEVLEGGSLGSTRRITVWGAKWGGDEDTDRALRYFRKYVKPYLVAAAIDYDLPTSPLHGSITRQVHASILAQRRQALGLEPLPPILSLPGVLSPEETRKKELEGGVVLVGRASMKEYFEGLRRGWTGGVDAWDWEKSIEGRLETDGVFDEPKTAPEVLETPIEAQAGTPEAASQEPAAVPAPSPSAKPSSGLGFLSRSAPSPITHAGDVSAASAGPQIPAHWHVPPNPLPAQPPLLLLPFENHIGFTQIPAMIASFFNERYRVQEGADAALALINSDVRPISKDDLEFDKKTEGYYNKAALELPKRIGHARKDYYDALAPRIDEVRAYEYGTREMTEEEKKSGKVVKLDELKEERKKKELRWMGNEEGWEIVKPEAEVAWNEGWEKWLKVFELPEKGKKDPTGGESKLA
ncbi:hypothetical protein IAU59_001011 [Kwoniella sp. CBS 9459]